MKKVKILKKGGMYSGNDAPWSYAPPLNKLSSPETSVNKSIKPVDRDMANVEVEKGEQIIGDLTGSGIPGNYTALGEPHSKGGTPLNLPPASFVFSKDKSMKIKDKDILKMFLKGGNSPRTLAEIAKRFDINEYQKILSDSNSDKLQKSTAEKMIQDYNEKLGKLSLVQESMKGFPDGIPSIATPYLETSNFDPTSIFQTDEDEDTNDSDNARYGKAFQMGGSTPGSVKRNTEGIPTYDSTESTFLNALDPSVELPIDTVEAMQPARGNRTFGRFNVEEADKNYSWLNKKINWQNPEEVRGAQETYNSEMYTRFLKAGYSPEEASQFINRIGFVSDPHLPNSLDASAGKYTETRKVFNPRPKQTSTPYDVVGNKEVINTAKDIIPNHVYNAANPESNDFWLQDIVNTTGAFNDMTRIHKYTPWQSTYNPVIPSPTFYDPTRALANNAEQSAMAMNAVASFSSPQSANARLSQIQGKSAASAANILGRYESANVGTANQFETQRASIMNQAGMQKAREATNLFDKNTIVNQNFDNAKNQARQRLREQFVGAITNRAQTQSLNSMTDQYKVDPLSGGFTVFNKGRKLDLNKSEQKSLMDTAQQILAQYPSFTNQQAFEAAKIQHGYK